MFPISLTIDKCLAELLPKYQYIFDYNGLKFNLPDDFESQLKNGNVKIKLMSLPQSCDLQFDESDFLDLLTALRSYDQDCKKAGGIQLLDSYDLIGQLRPRKIHGILALKACKSAIFIGEIINKQGMRDLVDHLRPLRRPWICAHGRPTMRYLINFDNFKAEFALPSRVQVDKNKYCSVSRKYRQIPPKLALQIGKQEQKQIDCNYEIYPTEELIQIKRQYLNQQQILKKINQSCKQNDLSNDENKKFSVQNDTKYLKSISIIDQKIQKPQQLLQENILKYKTQKELKIQKDELQIDNNTIQKNIKTAFQGKKKILLKKTSNIKQATRKNSLESKTLMQYCLKTFKTPIQSKGLV